MPPWTVKSIDRFPLVVCPDDPLRAYDHVNRHIVWFCRNIVTNFIVIEQRGHNRAV